MFRSIAAVIVLLAASTQAHALTTVYATSVYGTSGTVATPSRALGAPTFAPIFGPVTPFNPPFASGELVSIAEERLRTAEALNASVARRVAAARDPVMAGARADIAVDPLEGTTLCAKNQPDSICVLAMAERGGLLNAPDVYMQKLAIGGGYPPGTVDLDWSPSENIQSLARAKGVPVSEITVCVLDRPRHGALIEELRTTGASLKLISDGDIAGVIHATNSEETGIDIYLGSGGAPEGVLAAAALRCVGGQMQGRLILDTDGKRERARRMGITDPGRKYEVNDLASGDVLFAATGVTDGNLLDGVRFNRDAIVTSTVVMRSWTQTVRWIKAKHRR